MHAGLLSLLVALATFAEPTTTSPALVSSFQLQKSAPALPLGLWRKLQHRERTARSGGLEHAVSGGGAAQVTFAASSGDSYQVRLD